MTRTKVLRTGISVDLNRHQRLRSIDYLLFLNSVSLQTFSLPILTHSFLLFLFPPDSPTWPFRSLCFSIPTHLYGERSLRIFHWLKPAILWRHGIFCNHVKQNVYVSSIFWLTRVYGWMGSVSLLSIAGFKNLLVSLLYPFFLGGYVIFLWKLHLFFFAILLLTSKFYFLFEQSCSCWLSFPLPPVSSLLMFPTSM